jgi:hypothetical protein
MNEQRQPKSRAALMVNGKGVGLLESFGQRVLGKESSLTGSREISRMPRP